MEDGAELVLLRTRRGPESIPGWDTEGNFFLDANLLEDLVGVERFPFTIVNKRKYQQEDYRAIPAAAGVEHSLKA